MIRETDVREAERQARDVGAILVVLLGLEATKRRVFFDRERGFFVWEKKRVAQRSIRRLLERIERTGAKRVRAITQDYFDGRISLDEWLRRMRAAIAGTHILNGAVALGGFDAAVKSDFISKRIEQEAAFLVGFGSSMASGRVTEARAVARAASYLLAAAITYHVLDQRTQASAGKRFAQRVRTAMESCPGCLAFSGRWLPINKMPPIGSLDCGSHCRCYLIFK